MKRFIPYGKLSKRERRVRDTTRRVTWDISPVTRKPENPRAYKREKTRKCIEDALNVSFLICMQLLVLFFAAERVVLCPELYYSRCYYAFFLVVHNAFIN